MKEEGKCDKYQLIRLFTFFSQSRIFRRIQKTQPENETLNKFQKRNENTQSKQRMSCKKNLKCFDKLNSLKFRTKLDFLHREQRFISTSQMSES
jgi:hypothetical protein